MKKLLLHSFLSLLALTAGAEDFSILINRTNLEGNSLRGSITVNGQNIGDTLENDEFRIPPGRYSGIMRYQSQKNFVQGPNGEMSNTGDFLLEIAGVKDWAGRPRTSILFHGGSRPSHSEGCVLLGPVGKTRDGKPVITKDHPLYRLRVLFYGTETPNATPNKMISIEVSDKINREEVQTRRNLVGSWRKIGTSTGVMTFNQNGTGMWSEWDGNKNFNWSVKGRAVFINAPQRNYNSQWRMEGNTLLSGMTKFQKQ